MTSLNLRPDPYLTAPGSAGGGSVVTNIDVVLRQMGAQPLVDIPAYAAMVAAMDAGVSVTVTASGSNPFELIHAPTKTKADLPLLGPGAAWNGTIDTGWTSWTDLDGNARTAFPTTTAPGSPESMPSLVWASVNRYRFHEDFPLSVDGAVKGGFAYIDFLVEGGGVRVPGSDWSIIYDTDCNGVPFQRKGWHVALDVSAFLAVSASGEINCVAIGVPNDPTFTPVLLGVVSTTSRVQSSGDRDNTMFNFYPRSAEFSHTRTLSFGGVAADYVGATGFRQWQKDHYAGGWQRGKLTVIESGFLDLSLCQHDGTQSGAAQSSGQRPVVTHAPGVVMTLGMSSYTSGTITNAAGTWDAASYRPMLNGIEWRGEGLRWDHTNFSGISQLTFGSTTGISWPMYNNGTMTTNPTNDSSYYLWQDRKYRNAFDGGGRDNGFLEHCRGLNGPYPGFGTIARHCYAKNIGGVDLFNSTGYVDQIYVDGYAPSGGGDPVGAATDIPSIDIRGGGVGATETVAYTTASNGSVVIVQDALSATIPNIRTAYASQAAVIAAIQAALTTAGITGFTISRNAAVTADDRITDRHPEYFQTSGGKQSIFGATNCRNITVTMSTRNDVHLDADQWFVSSGVAQVGKFRRSYAILNASYLQPQFWDQSNGRRNIYATIFTDNDPSPFSGTVSQINVQTHRTSAILFGADPRTTLSLTGTSPAADPKVNFVGSVYGALGTMDGSHTGKAWPVFTDMHYAGAVSGSGGSQTGNTTGATGTGNNSAKLFPGYLSFDFNPGGDLLNPVNYTAEHQDADWRDVPVDIIGSRWLTTSAPKGPKAPRITSATFTKARCQEAAIWTSPVATGSGSVTYTWTDTFGVVQVLNLNGTITASPAL